MSLGAGGFGSGPVSVTKAQLPEVLFAACSEGLKPGALEVRCKVWKGMGVLLMNAASQELLRFC